MSTYPLLPDGSEPPRPSSRVLFENARLREAQDDTDETGQVIVARDLLRLLPTHSFSPIVYLCAFFTQVPLCPENGTTFEDIGHIFGPPVFGGPVPTARRMMVWFLKRWNRVSDGFLDADTDLEDPKNADGAASGSSPQLLSRRDMLMLERADSFELLAPEEQESHTPANPKKSASKWIWFGVSVGVLVIAGAVVAAVLATCKLFVTPFHSLILLLP